MNEVTRFSGMLTRMAFDYARSGTRRRGAKTDEPKPKPTNESNTTDELAVRAAMERALERRRVSKRIA
jgi:hypothetical protein